jgi:hypothetical protein
MPILTINDLNAAILNPTEKVLRAQLSAVQDTITATAGGGQANAVTLNQHNVRVTVCATGGDSTKLPPALAPTLSDVIIMNAGAAAMNLFPAVGDLINALSANTAISVPIGKLAIARCIDRGRWLVVIGA